jgi:hypothetical protein
MLKPKAVGRLTLAAIALCVVPGSLPAQAVPRRILPELRADASFGDVDAVQFGGGFHVNSGTYLRLALLAGAGRAWMDQDQSDSYRFEVQGRFHLDPLRDARLGLYGIGGVMTTHDRFRDWQSRLVVGAGVELPAHGRATFAVEAALAGGFRLTLVTRRLTLGRR